MSSPTVGDALGREQPRGQIDLAPLATMIAYLTRENGQRVEAAAIGQVWAVQAEERLKQITAADNTAADAPVAAPAPQHGARPIEARPRASVWWWFSERWR